MPQYACLSILTEFVRSNVYYIDLQIHAVVILGILPTTRTHLASVIIQSIPDLHVPVHIISGESPVDLELFDASTENLKRIMVWHHTSADENISSLLDSRNKRLAIVRDVMH